MMKLFFVAPLFLVFSLAVLAQMRPAGPKAFVSEEYGFSVQFPGAHWVEQDRRRPGELVQGIELKSIVQDVTCAVSVHDVVIPAGEPNWSAVYFDKLEAEFRADRTVREFTRKNLSGDAGPGIELSFQANGMSLTIRAWVVGPRIYDLQVTRPVGGKRTPAVSVKQEQIGKDFLASFRVTRVPVISQPLAVLPADFLERIEDGRLIVGRFGLSMDLPVGFESVREELKIHDDHRHLLAFANREPDHFKSFEVVASKLAIIGSSPLILAKAFLAQEGPPGNEITAGPTMISVDGVMFGYVGLRSADGLNVRFYVTERSGMVLTLRFACQNEADFAIFEELLKSVRLTDATNLSGPATK